MTVTIERTLQLAERLNEDQQAKLLAFATSLLEQKGSEPSSKPAADSRG